MVHQALMLAALFGAPPEISEVEFKQLHAELSAEAVEKWQTIPWKVDLLEARRAAIAAGKPLFLWSMNGHPLGCT